MKKNLLIVFLMIFNLTINAQTNLVPNPSFEIYSSCPNTLDELYLCDNWSSYLESPDYYNLCNTVGLGVPSNFAGYQNASDGNAYAGFIAYDVNGLAREILGAQLTSSLIIGQQYYVSIKVALAEFNGPPPQYIPCNKIGMKFSTIPFSTVTPVPINNFAHVYSNTIISDTLNWTEIKSSFIADSNYKYIMVGNFFDDLNTDTIYRVNGTRSYYFVDEVCVSTSSLTCFSTTGIDKFEKNNPKIYPNPAHSYMYVDYEINEECTYTITNITGETLFIEKSFNHLKIDTNKFSTGVYYLNIKTDKDVITKKIIINHQ
jgi:hypothetical protein